MTFILASLPSDVFEDLILIKKRAVDGFTLEPDPDYEIKWKAYAEKIAADLEGRKQFNKAGAFLLLQEKMVVYRQKVLHCWTINVPTGSDDGLVELTMTDGINVGRLSFKRDSSVANAWIDQIDHDIYVVRRMLTRICGELAAEDALIEGSERYQAWIEELIDQLSS